MFLSLCLFACNATLDHAPADIEPISRVRGIVSAADGSPIEGATVSLGDTTTTTDYEGLYTLEEIQPGDDLVVEFFKPGYTETYRRIDVDDWTPSTANATLVNHDTVISFDASEGVVAQLADFTIEIEPYAIIGHDGPAMIAVTHFEPNEMPLALPGDMSALQFKESDSAKEEYEPTSLVSYGMLNVQLTDMDYNSLELDELSPAKVSMSITNGELAETYHLFEGDEAPTWSFDSSRGLWVEEGIGEVVEDEAGNLVFEFEADHFSWWNCDQGYVPSCAFGRFVDVIGFPIASAEVVCQGSQMTSVTTTDQDGFYVCDIMVGDTVTITGTTNVGGRNYTQTLDPIFMDGEGSSAAECEPIPDGKIQACRISGNVNVNNIDAPNGNGEYGNYDNFNAHFWEPPGDPDRCMNPWWDLENDTCMIVNSDYLDTLPSDAYAGLEGSRSVGPDIKMSVGNDEYTIKSNSTRNGGTYYSWKRHEIDDDGNISEKDLKINDGDVLSVAMEGSSAHYFGPWEQTDFATVPESLYFTDTSELEWDGGTFNFSYHGENNDPYGALLMATSGDSTDTLVCRFTDDGTAKVSETLDVVAGEYGSFMLYHGLQGYATGPDSFPVFMQVFSGETRYFVGK